ncbi:MAG TPA: low molecular weight protein-tyrosine-phosphatase [Nitriliruptorales bacterium]
MRILFVCLGNICRSPTAENAFRVAAEQAGLDVQIDSAGTGGWQVGAPPDQRMTAAAAEVGLELRGSARKVRPSDFADHDLILAMDEQNRRDLEALAPPDARHRIRMLREFDPRADGDLEVPDPYGGGPDGFRDVVAMVRRAADELARAIAAGELST